MGSTEQKTDAINPSHYRTGRWMPIDLIEDKNLDFCLGNALKYISRAGKKDPDKVVEDYKKAIWYLQREKASVESGHCHLNMRYGSIAASEYCEDNGLSYHITHVVLEICELVGVNPHDDVLIRMKNCVWHIEQEIYRITHKEDNHENKTI
jgi:hypothetical protein